jgi:hypothetical protein
MRISVLALLTTLALAGCGPDPRLDQAAAFQACQIGTEKPPTEWDDDTAAAISHINATGPVPFDKNAALEKAFKHLGLYERDNTQRREDIRFIVELVG